MEWSLAPVNIPTIRAPTPTPGVSSAPRVRQALVHAASGISTRDAKQRVLSVDMRPLVIHLLDGLHRAGLERAVVCLGENASAVEHAVQTHAREWATPCSQRSTPSNKRVFAALVCGVALGRLLARR